MEITCIITDICYLVIEVDNMAEVKHGRGYVYSIQYHSEYHQSVQGCFNCVLTILQEAERYFPFQKQKEQGSVLYNETHKRKYCD